MLDYVYQFWINNLWLPFFSATIYLESKPAGIYVLIVILVVLAVIQTKIIKNKPPKTSTTQNEAESKHNKRTNKELVFTHKALIFKMLDGVLTIVCLFLLALIVGVCYVRFAPEVSEFFKDNNSQPSNNSTTSPTTNTQKQNTTTTPVYQAPKQLYYFCSCSGCYATGCSRNGYSYSGYSETSYLYYRSLCQACSCTSYYARSYWR